MAGIALTGHNVKNIKYGHSVSKSTDAESNTSTTTKTDYIKSVSIFALADKDTSGTVDYSEAGSFNIFSQVRTNLGNIFMGKPSAILGDLANGNDLKIATAWQGAAGLYNKTLAQFISRTGSVTKNYEFENHEQLQGDLTTEESKLDTTARNEAEGYGRELQTTIDKQYEVALNNLKQELEKEKLIAEKTAENKKQILEAIGAPAENAKDETEKKDEVDIALDEEAKDESKFISGSKSRLSAWLQQIEQANAGKVIPESLKQLQSEIEQGLSVLSKENIPEITRKLNQYSKECKAISKTSSEPVKTELPVADKGGGSAELPKAQPAVAGTGKSEKPDFEIRLIDVANKIQVLQQNHKRLTGLRSQHINSYSPEQLAAVNADIAKFGTGIRTLSSQTGINSEAAIQQIEQDVTNLEALSQTIEGEITPKNDFKKAVTEEKSSAPAKQSADEDAKQLTPTTPEQPENVLSYIDSLEVDDEIKTSLKNDPGFIDMTKYLFEAEAEAAEEAEDPSRRYDRLKNESHEEILREFEYAGAGGIDGVRDNISDYITAISNWEDGQIAEITYNGYKTRSTTVTLANGQKAYKCDGKYYPPKPDYPSYPDFKHPIDIKELKPEK